MQSLTFVPGLFAFSWSLDSLAMFAAPRLPPACCRGQAILACKRAAPGGQALKHCTACGIYLCSQHTFKCSMLGCPNGGDKCEGHIQRPREFLAANGPASISEVDVFVKCQFCFATVCDQCTRERLGGGLVQVKETRKFACGCCVLRNWRYFTTASRGFYFGLPPAFRPILLALVLVLRRRASCLAKDRSVVFRILALAYPGGVLDVARAEELNGGAF